MKSKFILVIFATALILVGCNTQNNNTLSSQEKQKLDAIDSSLSTNPQIVLLKEKKLLEQFIQNLEYEYEYQKKESIKWQLEKLNFWGLSANETVADLEKKTQDYLDKYHNGIKIGDTEFKKIVEHYSNPDSGAAKKAREDSEFGVLYSYMSLYKQFATNRSSINVLNDDIYNLTLLEICEKDFNTSFNANRELQQFCYNHDLEYKPPKQLTTKRLTKKTVN